MSDTSAGKRGHRVGRRILSLGAGIVTTVVLSYGTDYALAAMGVLPGRVLPSYGSEPLVAAVLIYRSLFAGVGCWVAAVLAPDHPMRHALALGALGLVGSIGGAIASRNGGLGPAWYSWGLVLLLPVSAWLGGRLSDLYPGAGRMAPGSAL